MRSSTSATSEVSPGARIRARVAGQLENLLLVLVVFWAGALWTVGFVVAPVLFDLIPERALAGSIAGRLFQTTWWISYGVGTCVLLHAFARGAVRSAVFWITLSMIALALVSAFGIQPRIAELRALMGSDEALRARFAMWHGVSSMLYAMQGMLAVVLVVKFARGLPRRDAA